MTTSSATDYIFSSGLLPKFFLQISTRGLSGSLGTIFQRKIALSLIHFFKEHLLGLPTEFLWLDRQKSEDFREQLE